jgi:hypothetical protein
MVPGLRFIGPDKPCFVLRDRTPEHTGQFRRVAMCKFVRWGTTLFQKREKVKFDGIQ